MNRAEALEKALRFYQNRKLEIEKDINSRQQQAEKKAPRLTELLYERAALPMKSLRLAMSNPEEAERVSAEMKERGLEINSDIRKALIEAGYPEDYLKPHYECSLCHDTGYLQNEMPMKTCPCFERRVLSYMREPNTNTIYLHRFEDFDESILPEESMPSGFTQREITKRIRQECEDFANRYPNTTYPGLILSGQVGVGKTFLLDCIYSRLTERGIDALRINGFELMERIRSKHFGQEDGNDTFEALLSVPVLLLDDLGSEPVIKGISAEYICLLINERMDTKRHSVITTNMTPPQYKEKYNDRLASRLMDKHFWDHLSLLGRDLRRT